MSLHRFESLSLALVLALFVVSAESPASGPEKHGPAKTNAVTTNDMYHPFLINNVYNYYSNNGDGSYNKFSSDNEGFEFSKGDNKHLIFEDGVVWGGFHKGFPDPKVGGSVYRHGLQAGPIVAYGTPTTNPTAADPSNPAYRVYRVRPDMNPNTVTEAGGEAILQADEVPFISRDEPSVTAASLWADYVKDWNEWPAALGAPFTDMDGNGVYNPAVDIPGVPGADQTLWYVANDLDSARVAGLAGCPSIGLEMQRTIWGYKRNGALGNVIFSSTLLINKSGAPVDSMFLAQFADPDIGDAGDDFVGCDTLRNLGYAYNGAAVDKTYGTAVPAPGFVLLQGPATPSPGDTAVFRGRYRAGFKNLGMTGFAMFTSGVVTYGDPRQGIGGNIDWYRLMTGLTSQGIPWLNPFLKQTTKFVFPGDPVKATDGSAGWVDGIPGGGLPPQDRRLCVITGPFRFAAGDTQEIVVATAGGLGADRISSITALRAVVDIAQGVAKGLFAVVPPNASVNVAFPSSAQASLTVSVDGRTSNLQKVSGSFRSGEGVSGPSFDLYDDGTHGDPVAGDRVFNTVQTLATAEKPVSLDLAVVNDKGTPSNWPDVQHGISIAGPLSLTGTLFSDNINSDGKINPGENIRFGLTTTNQTRFLLHGLTMVFAGAPDQAHAVAALASGAADSMRYDENNPGSYFSLWVFSMPPDSLLKLPFIGEDSLGNHWKLQITFLVFPLHDTIRTAVINPVSVVNGEGSFQISVIRPADVRPHLYAIYGVTAIDTAGNPGFTLKDSTDGRVLLLNHPLPDELGHTVPVTDGFKVLRGSITDQVGMRGWGVRGTRRFSPVGGSGLGLEGFSSAGDSNSWPDPANGSIGAGANFPFASTTLRAPGYHTVLLKLAPVPSADLWDPKATPADENFSRAYRYLRLATAPAARPEFAPWIVNPASGYAYQDFNYAVPFSAWDQSTTPPTRLAVGHLENNVVGGKVDGRWWPGLTDTDNVTSSGPREWCFIFATPYSTTPDPQYQVNLQGVAVPLMWVMSCTRRTATQWVAGDEFIIYAFQRPQNGNLWTFNPTVLLSAPEAGRPLRFALEQNYPNPFNPSTTIRFQLPSLSHVTLRIYDLLGREVVTLLNGTAGPGMHEVRWDARSVASGVYFYRLEATPQDGRGGKRVETRKMITLR